MFAEGHDSDCSHETECPDCHEIVRDAEHHTCLIVKGQP